jgi:hypothetical protein
LTTVNGSFVHKIAPTGIIVEALQAADFNSDGRDDVVCSGPLSVQTSFPPELRIFLSNAFGGVFLQTWVSLKGEIESLATSDVNLDGVVDVVTAGETPGYLGIYIGNGAGGLGAPADFAMASTYYPSIAVGDVNGDAMPDVVSVTRGWSAAGGGIMAVNFGLGGGLFSSPVRIGGSEPQGYGALSLGDLTSDGLTDIAVTTSSTLESGGEIRVVVFGALQGGQTEVVGSAESSSGLHPRSLALGDYDGDGDLDIAAAAETIHGVDVFLGVGDGSLEKRRVYAGGAGPRWVATADLNGNGLLDLAVAGWGSAVSTLLR